jgi:LEA14-like dessication related protein
MKRSLFSRLAALLAVVALVGVGSICERIAVINCEYDFAGIEPDFRLLDFDLYTGIEIENPNEVDVIIDKIDMDFYVNESKVADGSPTFGDTIPSGNTDTLYVTMTISYLDVLNELVNSIKDGSAAYELVGTVYFDTRVGEFDFPITIKEGEI